MMKYTKYCYCRVCNNKSIYMQTLLKTTSLIINIQILSYRPLSTHEWLNWVKQRGNKEVEEQMSEAGLEPTTNWSDPVLTPC